MDRLSLTTPFRSGATPLSFALGDFWAWAASDLLGNALRGLVAEFLVAQSVNATAAARVEWDAYDVLHPNGARLEVKASGFVQSWPQTRPSKPTFDIARKRVLDAATNTYSAAPCRSSDAYVFALHAHAERVTADPLDVMQWEFYVVDTPTIEARCQAQKSIGLGSLKRLCPNAAPYSQLAATVGQIIDNRGIGP